MKNKIQKIISTILVLALVAGCFAAMPLKANAIETSDGALYTIVNGYGNGYELGYTNGVRSDLLNDDGDIFPIKVENIQTGDLFPSFCFHGGSTRFAGDHEDCNGYMKAASMPLTADNAEVQNSIDKMDFLKAYNYIETNYGDVDAMRAITQIVTWAILGAIDTTSNVDTPTSFDNINWAIVEAGQGDVDGVPNAKEAVIDVMNNYADAPSKGKIVDLLFLICENEDHDLINCQPQIVPVYGEIRIVKNVNGTPLFDWLAKLDSAVAEQVLNSMYFTLYATQLDDTVGRKAYTDVYIAQTTTIGADNSITFKVADVKLGLERLPKEAFCEGWYEIVEDFSDPIVKAMFEPVTLQVFFDGVNTFGDEIDFDYDAFYTIDNGYGSGYTLGYAGLNNNGDIFHIGVINSVTGEKYDSFCANGGSRAFAGQSGMGCEGYMIAYKDHKAADDYSDFIKAYNYIKLNMVI